MRFDLIRRLFFLYTLTQIAVSSPLYSQDSISFKKHTFIRNTLTGHRWGIEIPIELSRISTSDYDYEATDAKNPNLFGVSFKLYLKNGWGRGIAFGLGMDYSTNNYFRVNIPFDLDFLFAYSIPLADGEFGKAKQFTVSMFSKFVFSKILAKVDGYSVQEYYLRTNIIHFQFNKLAFCWGPTFGLFRNTYTPYFAEKGTWYSISYIFTK